MEDRVLNIFRKQNNISRAVALTYISRFDA